MKKIIISILMCLFLAAPTFAAEKAKRVSTDTANFDNNLSSADDNVQKALETLDELAGGSGDSGNVNSSAVTNFNLLDNLFIDWALNTTPSPDDVTASWNLDETLAGNPALPVDNCVFGADTSGFYFICEGSTADTNEQLYRFPNINTEATHYILGTSAEIDPTAISAFLDEDNMASNSATALASQQSIKAYVDSQDHSDHGDGANCPSGQSPLGVDENGAVQSCTNFLENIVEDTTPQAGADIDMQGNNIDEGGVINLIEQAAADPDIAGRGQIWVKTATPNQLWFTDDAGNDREVVYSGGAFHDGFSDFVANEHIDHTGVTLTAGAGLSGGGDISGNRSFATASNEEDFILSGALTCGANTAGKMQVHTTPLQYCDNAATPTLRYAAYASSDGDALAGDSATGFFDAGQIENTRGGTGTDSSGSTGLARVDSGTWTYSELSGVISTSGSNVTTMGNDQVDSQHYVANSIDDEHMNTTECWNLRIHSGKISGDRVTDGDASQGMAIDGGEGGWRGFFDASTDEGVVWQRKLPTYWGAHSSFKITYSMVSGTANEVEFESAIDCKSDGDTVATVDFSTIAVASATVPVTAGQQDTLSITLNDDSCAADDNIFFYVSTDADDATNDDATGDREVHTIEYCFTR